MPKAACSDAEFIKLFEGQGAAETARRLKINTRQAYERRSRLEKRLNRKIYSPGTMAEPGGPQFIDYLEDNPVNWRSGFVVLTIKDGRMLWPEVVHVLDEQHVEFRGEIIQV